MGIEFQEMKKVNSSNVLGVEGKDEENFFNSLLAYMGISGVKVRNLEGKTRFKTTVRALVKTPDFKRLIKKFAIIRDADDSADDAFKSVSNLLNKISDEEQFNLSPPKIANSFTDSIPKVGIFIMPGNSEKGMLESLCLKTVQNTSTMNCVDLFMECVDKLEIKPNNKHKAKAQAYQAAMEETTYSVGIGAQKGHWNLESPELDEIKSFLEIFR